MVSAGTFDPGFGIEDDVGVSLCDFVSRGGCAALLEVFDDDGTILAFLLCAGLGCLLWRCGLARFLAQREKRTADSCTVPSWLRTSPSAS